MTLDRPPPRRLPHPRRARPAARRCAITSPAPGRDLPRRQLAGRAAQGHRRPRGRGGAQEWGQGLIRSWNTAGWFDLPQRVGDKIARLMGAGPNEVVADSTSINLFKVLSAALNIAREDAPQRKPHRERAQQLPDRPLHRRGAVQGERGCSWCWWSPRRSPPLTSDVAVLMLTHVNYRTGAMHDMAAHHRRRPRRRRILASGTWRTAPAPCRWT
jgi:kynureninase